MLFVLFILLIGVGIGIYYFAEWLDGLSYENRKKNKLINELYYKSDMIGFAGTLIGLTGATVSTIMLLALPFIHCGNAAEIDMNNERYKALTYKVESGACRDEFGLLSKEVIDEIQEWNESVVRNKRLQNDLWVGVFVPDIYDELETIDYERYVR